MRRWLWVIPTALLVAAVLADTAVWYVTVEQMRDGLMTWVAARRAEGWNISAVAPEAGGWPLAATLTLRDLEISGGKADLPGGLAWRADQVELLLGPRHPHVLRIAASGLQKLRVSNAPDIAYSAKRLELLVPLQADPAAQPLDLQGESVRSRVAVAGVEDAMTIGSLKARLMLRSEAGRNQPAMSLAATANDIVLPQRVNWPLGPHVRALSLDGVVDGPLSDAATLTQRATAWRDGGGVIHLLHIALHWGALNLNAHSTLRLDQQLQPTATATANVGGYAPTLDVLARDGVISNAAAISAKAMLSLLAAAPSGGGPSEVEVPLSLQNGTVAMHEIPLLRLPQLDWPPS